MRHIDIEQLQGRLPQNWLNDATAALAEVRGSEPSGRHEAIDRHSNLWRDLKSELAALSHGKCWYCESKEIRSDNTVDHFRPKNRIAECPDHGGYWWLAFDWRNYRFCCTYCNSQRTDPKTQTAGGKADYFPLMREDRRARDEDANCQLEEPELIDPTVPSDPGLIGFLDDGRAVERYDRDLFTAQHRRAKTSIKLYHLNHVLLVEERKKVCNKIRNLVRQGDVHFGDLLSNASAQHGFENVIRELQEALRADGEYAAAARIAVLGCRDSQHWWVDSAIAPA